MAYSGPWRVAESLDVLLGQINALAPHRSKRSDGSIADDVHEKSSDHYPKVISGLGPTPTVTARDLTHDPGGGADMGVISEALRRSKDRRIAYVIFNRRIFSSTVEPWQWRPYSGDSPHTEHMHASVVHSALADDETPWQIGDDDMSLTPLQDKRLQATDARLAAVVGMKPTHKSSWSDANPNGVEQVLIVQEVLKQGAKLDAVTKALAQVAPGVAAALKADLDEIDAANAAVLAAVEEVPEETLDALGAVESPAEIADLLRPVLGDKAAAVGAILAAG